MPATLLHPRYLLPIAPVNEVFEGISVAFEEGMIIEIAPRAELESRYPGASAISLDSHTLMPGLVNAHGHFAMTLLRGLGESKSLELWLKETIWPLEKRWVDAQFVLDGAELAIAEMIASGTTCASDMYWFPEVVAQAATNIGFRIQVAFPITDHENAWARSADECIHKGLALHDQQRDQDLVRVAFGLHSPYTVEPQVLSRIQTLADELDTGIQIHLHETAAEVAAAHTRYGTSWVHYLHNLGLLTSSLQAVHMTQLDDEEIELVGNAGAHVIHCPQSNLKLASGRCRVADLAKAGINVGLGTDGAASNNSLDLFQEMRAAALIWKSSANDAAAAPATDMLQMATIGGARALNLDHLIGSVEVGKAADLIAINLDAPNLQPLNDLHAQLVHTQAGHHVTHVWIRGQSVLVSGRYTTLDVDRTVAQAKTWAGKIALAG
jgi:5-methylthioadenosine/S-adenosylhomocysteine deaminase